VEGSEKSHNKNDQSVGQSDLKNVNRASLTPPDDQSVESYVSKQWSNILNDWKLGWPADTNLDSLDSYVEYERQEIFEKKSKSKKYNWERDWLRAKSVHDSNIDFVRNRKKYNEDLIVLWSEWHRDVKSHLLNLSLEALRAMILLNGAAIITSITILSGEVIKPSNDAAIASRVAILGCVFSLVMMASGQAALARRLDHMANTVRGVLIGHPRHRRIYAIGRYVERNMRRVSKFAEAMIYGSIFVFGLTALISAIILI
jgi:hypothetical protein